MTMNINPSTTEGEHKQRDQVLIFSCGCSINPSTPKCASHRGTVIIITNRSSITMLETQITSKG